MSRQDLEEKRKCPYKSFREFDRKLITITSKNRVFDNDGISNLENPFIGFVDLDDAFTASLRIPHEGGELGDYIEFYKEAFLKRQSVPIHTIPKQFKNVYLKFQGKNKTLKK